MLGARPAGGRVCIRVARFSKQHSERIEDLHAILVNGEIGPVRTALLPPTELSGLVALATVLALAGHVPNPRKKRRTCAS